MTSALFCNITQRVVVIPYRRFGAIYRSHLHGSRNPRTSNPEERTYHLFRGGSPKKNAIFRCV